MARTKDRYVFLECAGCKNRTYTVPRNPKAQYDKLERKKFCRFCRSHTVHKEKKIS